MDYWLLLSPIGGFDFSKLKYYDQNEIKALRKLFKKRYKKEYIYRDSVPSWWEPETPGKAGMSSFGTQESVKKNVRKKFRPDLNILSITRQPIFTKTHRILRDRIEMNGILIVGDSHVTISGVLRLR